MVAPDIHAGPDIYAGIHAGPDTYSRSNIHAIKVQSVFAVFLDPRAVKVWAVKVWAVKVWAVKVCAEKACAGDDGGSRHRAGLDAWRHMEGAIWKAPYGRRLFPLASASRECRLLHMPILARP
jgi:hypothetical protein